MRAEPRWTSTNESGPQTLRSNLTKGDGDIVSLTGNVVHSTVSIGRRVGWRRAGAQTDFEGVGRVLDGAVAYLLSDTDGVVLVGEMDSSSKVVTLQSSRHSGEPLSTAWPRSPLSCTLDLTVIEMSWLELKILVSFLTKMFQVVVPLNQKNSSEMFQNKTDQHTI